ncbi:MAG TPA: glutathione synthase [Candidatus Kryptonia bacterium]|nr:glutathione synthase [Candidatus Kryptonia bacterium]
MRFLFVMDPLERILPDKDTTFVFMLESQRRSHEVFFCGADDIFIDRTTPHARMRRAEVRRVPVGQHDGARHYQLFEERTEALERFDVVFMRKDPPFDLDYFYATHLLSLIDPGRTLVVNNPRGLREANEKLYALNFPTAIPETFVSSDAARLKQFLHEMGGEMIIKPLGGCGGAGVFHIHRDDRNLNALIETATVNGTQLIMAQRYLPAVRQGDKRLIVLDGEPLGGCLRVPREDEHRGNIHVGGVCVKTDVTARDREIAAALAPRLRADGLYFVGLDIIGGYLTEVNVTSPTGVQEINKLDGVCLEAQVIDFVEQRVAALPAHRGRSS